MEGPLAGGSYEIVVGATLSRDWSDSFEGFEIETAEDATVLRGEVPDQAALHGVLARLRDLAIPLLGVRQVPTGAYSHGRNTDLDPPAFDDDPA